MTIQKSPADIGNHSFDGARFTGGRWVVLALIMAVITLAIVEWLFARAQYPVSLLEGQLSFSATNLMDQYAQLIEQGTFNRYVLVQIVDLFVPITWGFMGWVVSRTLLKQLGFKRSLAAIFFIWAMPFCGLMDASENTVSFFLLSSPSYFPEWPAQLYSSFALMKLISSGLWNVALLFLLGHWLVGTLTSKS